MCRAYEASVSKEELASSKYRTPGDRIFTRVRSAGMDEDFSVSGQFLRDETLATPKSVVPGAGDLQTSDLWQPVQTENESGSRLFGEYRGCEQINGTVHAPGPAFFKPDPSVNKLLALFIQGLVSSSMCSSG